MYLNGVLGTIFEEEVLIPIHGSYARTYKLAVASMVNFPEYKRSENSELIEVKVTSKRLPLVQITNHKSKDGEITLQWKYKEGITDLKGFRVLVNDEVALDESSLKASSRIAELVQEAGSYKIQMVAVSESGVVSNLSRTILIKLSQ